MKRQSESTGPDPSVLIRLSLLIVLDFLAVVSCRHETGAVSEAGVSFSVSWNSALEDDPQDGRLLLMLSTI